MARLDADELIKKFAELEIHYATGEGDLHDSPMFEVSAVLATIDEASTVDAEQVQHGKWISDLYKEVSELEEKQREFTNRSLNDTEFLTRNGILTGITMVKHLIADFQTLKEGE